MKMYRTWTEIGPFDHINSTSAVATEAYMVSFGKTERTVAEFVTKRFNLYPRMAQYRLLKKWVKNPVLAAHNLWVILEDQCWVSRKTLPSDCVIDKV